ncbi:HNH endonuclease [Burkholderia pseudomallei]|uniref:HNH endonuclease n=1 Tax=Burkholderia pseudomallei TaxID=28450 RepID=UPI000536FF45|nr:HNH endonuclease [Burkholderia pseudomallei]KGV49451.1 AP2 domain protein [Burkholderia pseudomallei BDU 2]
MPSLVSPARLKRLLHYEEQTGLFFKKVYQGPFVFVLGRIVGTPRADGYLQMKVDGRNYLAHRLAFLYMTGEWPNGFVDHQDGQRSNNRWSNLRVATASENVHNIGLSRSNTSGVKGVSLHKASGKWAAQVSKNGVSYFLGLHTDIKDAAEAVRAKREELHGEFTNHGEK